MDLGELTDVFLELMLKFDKINENTLARESWIKYYKEARDYYGTIDLHQTDFNAYEVANRKLEQLYNITTDYKQIELNFRTEE